MRKAFIISIVVLLVFVIAGFFYFALYAPSLRNSGSNSIDPYELLKQPLSESHIVYVLAGIGVEKLHNPPLSSDTPKISFVIDGEKFSAEVKKGEVFVKKEEISNEDIVITSSYDEIVWAIKSSDSKGYFADSVKSGKTKIELKAEYPTLLAKGYLSFYKGISGKSLSGSVVKIVGS